MAVMKILHHLGFTETVFRALTEYSYQTISKFARSGKIRRIWNTLMQLRRYPGFLLEGIGLFVDEAELFFLFQATNCHFPS